MYVDQRRATAHLPGFKSAQFLNFFFARVEPLPGQEKGEAASEPREDDDAAHWTEDPQELAKVMQAHDGSPPSEAGWEELWKRLHSEGLTWLSKCQGEWNVIHAVDTPVVFRTLSEDGVLTWGGDYTMPMDPTQLLVHPETGYLYHPSPYPAALALAAPRTGGRAVAVRPVQPHLLLRGAAAPRTGARH